MTKVIYYTFLYVCIVSCNINSDKFNGKKQSEISSHVLLPPSSFDIDHHEYGPLFLVKGKMIYVLEESGLRMTYSSLSNYTNSFWNFKMAVDRRKLLLIPKIFNGHVINIRIGVLSRFLTVKSSTYLIDNNTFGLKNRCSMNLYLYLYRYMNNYGFFRLAVKSGYLSLNLNKFGGSIWLATIDNKVVRLYETNGIKAIIERYCVVINIYGRNEIIIRPKLSNSKAITIAYIFVNNGYEYYRDDMSGYKFMIKRKNKWNIQ